MATRRSTAGSRKSGVPRKATKTGKEDPATVDEFEREGMGVAPKE